MAGGLNSFQCFPIQQFFSTSSFISCIYFLPPHSLRCCHLGVTPHSSIQTPQPETIEVKKSCVCYWSITLLDSHFRMHYYSQKIKGWCEITVKIKAIYMGLILSPHYIEEMFFFEKIIMNESGCSLSNPLTWSYKLVIISNMVYICKSKGMFIEFLAKYTKVPKFYFA